MQIVCHFHVMFVCLSAFAFDGRTGSIMKCYAMRWMHACVYIGGFWRSHHGIFIHTEYTWNTSHESSHTLAHRRWYEPVAAAAAAEAVEAVWESVHRMTRMATARWSGSSFYFNLILSVKPTPHPRNSRICIRNNKGARNEFGGIFVRLHTRCTICIYTYSSI